VLYLAMLASLTRRVSAPLAPFLIFRVNRSLQIRRCHTGFGTGGVNVSTAHCLLSVTAISLHSTLYTNLNSYLEPPQSDNSFINRGFNNNINSHQYSDPIPEPQISSSPNHAQLHQYGFLFQVSRPRLLVSNTAGVRT